MKKELKSQKFVMSFNGEWIYSLCSTRCIFPDEEYQQGVQVGGPGPLDHPAEAIKLFITIKQSRPCLNQQVFK